MGSQASGKENFCDPLPFISCCNYVHFDLVLNFDALKRRGGIIYFNNFHLVPKFTNYLAIYAAI